MTNYDKVSQQAQNLLGSLLNKMTLSFIIYYRYISLFVGKRPWLSCSILLVLVNKKVAEQRTVNQRGMDC